MRKPWVLILLLISGGRPTLAPAGIPEPDVVLYGFVVLAGGPATPGDAVTVLARVVGAAQPVGEYTLGQNPAAGNDYELHIRVESLSDGALQSDNAALVGQTAHLFVRQGGGPETPVANHVLAASGVFQRLDLAVACDAVRPVLIHAQTAPPPAGPRTVPCSGYVDPRVEITIPGGEPAGLQAVTLVFSEAVHDAGSGAGGSLTAAAFHVTQTGPGQPPAVSGITQAVDPSGRHVATLTFDAPLAVQQWTTVRAEVEDGCGNTIENLGNLGADILEPDRVDLGFLPCDIDQSGLVGPVDFLRFRQFLFGTCSSSCPSCDSSDHYYDMDRSGTINAVDVLRFRQWVFGTGSARQPWNGQALPPQP